MQTNNYPAIGETLYSEKLANGLQLYVIPKRGFNTSYAAFATNYGGSHRRFYLDGELFDTPAGVAHYLEHKMFDMPNGDNALSVLTSNGADPNAFTSSGLTCYYFQCNEKFEENLRLLLHFVSSPYFTEETVQKEQGIIAQEILMGEDSPGTAIYYNLLNMLFEHHPIRDRVAGTVESISHITHETLYACHRAFYAPSNMILCVEGDVDVENVRAIAEEILPKELREIPSADFGEEEGLLPLSAKHEAEMSVSAPQFLIGMKFARAKGGNEFLRQRLVAQLSLRLLVGSSSPYYARLYADGTLNHDFDYEADFSAGTATVMIGGESTEPEKVFEELMAEVERINREGFDSAAFERAKRASFGARLRGFEDFENVCLSVVMGGFEGYCAMEAPSLLQDITRHECEEFIRDNFRRERFAVSIIKPKRG